MTCHVARRVGEFERRLRRERLEVGRAIQRTDVELAGLEEQEPAELVDDAARETTLRVLAFLEERDRPGLAEIDAARERLFVGTFGICEACRGPIPVPRLRATADGAPVSRVREGGGTGDGSWLTRAGADSRRAMWNEAPLMLPAMEGRLAAPPRLRPEEMADLVAYLRSFRLAK